MGGALGASRGLGALVLYTVMGLIGVLWFAAGHSGYSASFGHIVGSTLAAGLVGALARRGADRRVWTNILVMGLFATERGRQGRHVTPAWAGK